jgi:hypothetical protein
MWPLHSSKGIKNLKKIKQKKVSFEIE